MDDEGRLIRGWCSDCGALRTEGNEYLYPKLYLQPVTTNQSCCVDDGSANKLIYGHEDGND